MKHMIIFIADLKNEVATVFTRAALVFFTAQNILILNEPGKFDYLSYNPFQLIWAYFKTLLMVLVYDDAYQNVCSNVILLSYCWLRHDLLLLWA